MSRIVFSMFSTAVLCFFCSGTAIAQSDAETSAPAVGAKIFSRSEVAQKIDAILDTPAFRNARWGVMIEEAGSSEPLYVREADKSYVPASNMKMYTTAAAVDMLGADWQWETKFLGLGKISNGTLRGDLVMLGSGDPSISGRYQDTQTTAILRNIAKAVKASGVTRISGNVIGDDSYFSEDYAPTWPWADLPEWYSTESGALAVNDNCWDALIVPSKKVGQKATIKKVFPEGEIVTFVSEVETTVSAKEGGKTSINISRRPDSNVVTLSGSLPVDAAPYKEWGSVRYGSQMAVRSMVAALRAEGIRVGGKALVTSQMTAEQKKNVENPREMMVLYVHKSPTLSRVIRMINKPSQNFYADMLCRTLDKVQGGTGNWSGCERVVEKWLRETVGADTYGFAMMDGSGLSRRNMVRPDLSVALLKHLNNVSKEDAKKAFYDSLPIAGVDGTIASRMKKTAAACNCRAKTGYIGSMRSLSGYVDDKVGRRWVFSMMANNFVTPVSNANAAQDQVVELLANLEGEPVK